MSLPRAFPALCWCAAVTTCVVSFSAAVVAAWQFIRFGGLQMPARPVALIDGSTEAVVILIYFACAALTGWRGMNREAGQ